MARGTNLSHDAHAEGRDDAKAALLGSLVSGKRGIRTHLLLVLAMALVTTIVTGVCLLLIRERLRTEVRDNLARDLSHSVIAFQDLQAERFDALDRENALLADLPTLKALMTSGDDLTIQDGAVEFWQISGNDLFALADSNDRVVAVYTKGSAAGPMLRQDLRTLLAAPKKHYLIDGDSLYACTVRPLYFGSAESGTILGYVISGASIERTVSQISHPTGVEAAFVSGGRTVASTLSASVEDALSAQHLPEMQLRPAMMRLGDARFFAATEDLSASATSPLQLVVLKSFEPAEQSINHIDRLVLGVGLLALFSGTVLMVALSRWLTHPLEELSKSVRAFGGGFREYRIPPYGTREVRELSTAFAAMRNEIQKANRALVESERLATIGRMASSVSHDFRHYLAAVYANAEFLASGKLSAMERAEIFAEIRAAVLGTTDMIESLLIFSRTGKSMKTAPELMATLAERAAILARSHPDAEGVTIVTGYGDPTDTAAMVDGKQIERAIFNLLLNACQADRSQGEDRIVSITIELDERYITVNVADNGSGVPENIRNSLFEPFVSEGKQKGTGLGLTLVHCIAQEHGGEVTLLRSRPGETVFQMRIQRGMNAPSSAAIQMLQRHDQVVSHENT